jgi:hypothetical protein
MGGWEAWNAVKKTTNGWRAALLNDTTVISTASGVLSFSYQTLTRLLEQIPAVPRVTRTILDPQIRKMMKGMARVVVEDVTPLAIAGWAHHCIQEWGREYLAKHPEEEWLSAYTALQTGLCLLWIGNKVYGVRKTTQATVRILIQTMATSNRFNHLNQTLPMTLCKDSPTPCSGMRFLKGSFRELIEYGASVGAVTLISFIPIVGSPLYTAGTIYINGRYVTTLVLPTLCGPHQGQYLREYPELALSLGLTHYYLTGYAVSLVEYYSGIPAVFFQSPVDKLFLIIQTGIASQITLPPPVRESQRFLDPLGAYERAIGFCFDTVVIGLKTQLPRLLKKNKMASWLTGDQLIHAAEKVWCNPISDRLLKPLLLPRMLRSIDALKNDPVIPWEDFRRRCISAIDNTQKVHKYLLAQVAMTFPKITAELAKSLFDMPKWLTEILIDLMNNEKFMLSLSSYKNWLAVTCRGEPPPVSIGEPFLLREQESEPIKIIPDTPIADNSLVIAPQQIILPLAKSTRVEGINEEEDASQCAKLGETEKVTPSMVIKLNLGNKIPSHSSAQSGFFSHSPKLDPSMILRKRTESSQSSANFFAT